MIHEQQEKMIKKYRIISSFYDLTDYAFRFGKNKNPRFGLAGEIHDEPLKILDVCCGTGNSAIAIAEKCGRATIAGVDLSPHMLAVAERKIRKRGIANISLSQMNAAALEYPDRHFDIATSSFALHEMEPGLMMAVLGEMARVLKRNGKLYIIDYENEDNRIKQFFFSIYLRISYPRHVRDFLRHNWREIMEDIGFKLDAIKKYRVSKLICATKLS